MLLVALFLGIVAGRLLRGYRRPIRAADGAAAAAIYLLLFLLGLTVGGDRSIMGALEELGVQALVLSVGSIIGSVLLAAAVSAHYFDANEE